MPRKKKKTISVLLADDHRMVAEALKSLLAPEFELLDIVEDGRALIAAASKLRPDVIVADITMPRLNGTRCGANVRRTARPAAAANSCSISG